MATGAYALGTFNIASVDRLRFTLTKDGVTWDPGTVNLYFEQQQGSGLTLTKTAITRESAGVFYYDTLVTDFPAPAYAGSWKVAVEGIDGAVRKRYPFDISFLMNNQP